MKAKVKKYDQQNFLDFCLTNFGKDYYKTIDICKQLGYSSYMDYYSDTRQNVILDLPLNDSIVSNNITNNTYFASGSPVIYIDLEYNHDLTPKTVINGSFNIDFNDDFDIERFNVVTVGFEGMDLYFLWSITNNGITDQTITQLVQFDGYPDRTITTVIKAGHSYQFKEVYQNVSAGYKTIHIKNITTNIIFEDSLTIYVVPAVNFVSNEDFHYTNSSYIQGDTLNLQWSLHNEGSGSGVYNGVFKVVHNNITTEYPVSALVQSSQNYTFLQNIPLTDSGNYSFISSFGDVININVEALAPNIVYNNDLFLKYVDFSHSGYYDRNRYYAQFSYTNQGSIDGTITVNVQLTPDDQINIQQVSALVPAGQTYQFSVIYKLLYGSRSVIINADNGSSDAITVNVQDVGMVYTNKLSFYTDKYFNAPPVHDVQIPVYSTSDQVVIYANLTINEPYFIGATYGKNDKFRLDGVIVKDQTIYIHGSEPYLFQYVIPSSSVGTHTVEYISDGYVLGKIYYKIV